MCEISDHVRQTFKVSEGTTASTEEKPTTIIRHLFYKTVDSDAVFKALEVFPKKWLSKARYGESCSYTHDVLEVDVQYKDYLCVNHTLFILWTDEDEVYAITTPFDRSKIKSDQALGLKNLLPDSSIQTVLRAHNPAFRVYGILCERSLSIRKSRHSFLAIIPRFSEKDYIDLCPRILSPKHRTWLLCFKNPTNLDQLTEEDLYLLQIFAAFCGKLYISYPPQASSNTLGLAALSPVLRSHLLRFETLKVILQPHDFTLSLYCTGCLQYRDITEIERSHESLFLCKVCHAVLV